MSSMTLTLIYHTQDFFFLVLKEILLIGFTCFLCYKRDVHELVYTSAAMLCKLFDKLVAPVILYASEIGGFYASSAVERVHLKF